MDEHKKFLADRLLSEEQPITYRVLSRALDVHVNTAKEMLYDFHKYQNGLRADSIHATYLIFGTKSSDNMHANGDVEMASSMPEPEPVSEEVPTSTMTLARQEDLQDVLAAYEKVVSIHVYSLAPHPQKDLSLLSDVTTQVAEYMKKEDAITAAKKYGIIVNPQVRRRDRKGRQTVATQATEKPIKQEPKSTAAAKVKQEASAPQSSAGSVKTKQETSAPSSKDVTPSSSNNSKKPAPALKRGLSGGIMQSFARAAAKPPKPKPAPKKEEDTDMHMSDDGEADDDDIPVVKKAPVDTEALMKAKKEREEALRRMMEDDDDEEDQASEKEEEEEEEPADEEMEEAPEPEPAPPEPKKEEPAEIVSSSGDGRRRGKRRIMKKKRILDDQGYMVTIQEPGWESFSEDEAPRPAKKPTPTPKPTPSPSSSAPKAKKPAAKGQGNIMSFFSKK